jgi:hypothetical protein
MSATMWYVARSSGIVAYLLAQALVPFASPYRPFAVGLGVLAAELAAAVGLTNMFRSRMPHNIWRRFHYLTLAVWGLATGHGFLAGTDRLDPWFAGIATAIVSSVAIVVFTRFSPRRLAA